MHGCVDGILLNIGNYIRDKWVRHHSMAQPQVADRGTTSNIEGSSEYIE